MVCKLSEGWVAQGGYRTELWAACTCRGEEELGTSPEQTGQSGQGQGSQEMCRRQLLTQAKKEDLRRSLTSQFLNCIQGPHQQRLPAWEHSACNRSAAFCGEEPAQGARGWGRQGSPGRRHSAGPGRTEHSAGPGEQHC